MRYFFALILTSFIADAAGQPMMPGDPSFLQSTSSLRKGLVGYWRLEEASGTRYDCSPYGNHLTANNSPGQAAGKVGNCADLTAASSQYLSIADNPSLATGDIDLTLTFWVNLKDTSHFANFFQKWGSAPNQEIWLGFDSGYSKINSYVSSTGSNLTNLRADTFGTLTSGVWYFVIFWHDSVANTLNLQINNTTPDSLSYSAGIHSGTAPWEFGWAGGANYANANVDEMGYWKRVLTAAERTQLYNSGLGTHFPWAHK